MNFAPDVIDPPPPFTMVCESDYERKRRDTWRSKEPETIAWIDSFTNGDIFFDIGANVGIYSLYCAAVHPQCRVYACEPDVKNYMRLCENVKRNGFRHVQPLHIAVADKNGVGTFAEASPIIGSSGGQYDQMLCNGQAHYHVTARTVDALAEVFGTPNHVKIDIDGQEWKVVQGMRGTLRNRALRSVLIEFEQVACSTAISFNPQHEAFISNGFTTDNPFNTMTPHSRTRRAADGIGVENVVFTRG